MKYGRNPTAITTNFPGETELTLCEEAARAGVPLETFVERVIAERFENLSQPQPETRHLFFGRIGRPGPVIDACRENIYSNV